MSKQEALEQATLEPYHVRPDREMAEMVMAVKSREGESAPSAIRRLCKLGFAVWLKERRVIESLRDAS